MLPAANITARFPAQLQSVLRRVVVESFQRAPLAEQKALGKETKKPRQYKSIFLTPTIQRKKNHLPRGCPNAISVSTVQTF